MKRIILVYIILSIACLPPALFGSSLKFASLAPEGTSWMNRMHMLAEELSDSTDGRVTIKMYPGGVAGDERDMLRKIRIGQLHAAGFTGNGLGEIVSAVRLLDTPFLFSNIEEYDTVLATVSDTLKGLFREQKYELAGWASVGMVYLLSKKPIQTTEDLKKSRPWVWETDPLAAALFEHLGISPIPLPLPQVLTSLQTGVIDVAYASPTGAVSLQWFTRVSYLTDLPLAHSTGGVIISSAFLDKLNEHDRRITLDLFEKHLSLLEPLIRDEEKESLKVLRDEGIEFVSVFDEDIASFHELGDDIRNELAGKLYPEWLLKTVESKIASLRAGDTQ